MTQTSLDPRAIRQTSEAKMRSLHIPVNDALPLLDSETLPTRCASAAAYRALCIKAVVATAFDASRLPAVNRWIERECLKPKLSHQETEFLRKPTQSSVPRFQWRVEALYALQWAGDEAAECLVTKELPDDLVNRLPAIQSGDSVSTFVEQFQLRAAVDLVSALDCLYCMHWAMRQSNLDGKPIELPIDPRAVCERRYALEWLTSSADWDEIELDT